MTTPPEPEEPRILRDVDFWYVNFGLDGKVHTVVKDRETGEVIWVPGGELCVIGATDDDG